MIPTAERDYVVQLLEYYPVCKRFLDSRKYAADYFGASDTKDNEYRETMSLVETLIKSIAPSDEYTLLYLRYIKGLSVEKCAECMNISRATGYRLLKRAQDKVYRKHKRAKGAIDEQRD